MIIIVLSVLLIAVWTGAILFSRHALWHANFPREGTVTKAPPSVTNETSTVSTQDNSTTGKDVKEALTVDPYGEHECPVLMSHDNYDRYLGRRIADMFILFVGPVACMTYMYARIIWKLWGKGMPVTDIVLRRRKEVKLLLLTTGLFFVCWLPFHFNEFSTDFDSENPQTGKTIYAGAAAMRLRFAFLLWALSYALVTPCICVHLYDNVIKNVTSLLTRR